MRTNYLLAGLSALAFTAGTASAQVVNDNATTSSGLGNSAACNNGDAFTSTGNFCRINQTGDGNSAAANQEGDNNESRITQTGDANSAIHTQTGQFNDATTTQTGDNHFSRIRQDGNRNTGTNTQTGDFQNSQIRQSSTAPVDGSIAGNSAAVTQSGVDDSTAESNLSLVSQGGNRNDVTVSQSGRRNNSQVTQGVDLDANGVVTGANNTGSENNAASVVQDGNDTLSIIRQGASAAGNADLNIAIVNIGNNGSGAVVDSESGGDGFSNRSDVNQDTASNYARVFIRGGETQRNSSSIAQRGGAGNEADVSLARGGSETAARGNQQQSDIDQNGRDNYATVTMTGGIAGINDPGGTTPGLGAEAGRSGGNFATIDQIGGGNSVSVQTGNQRQAFRGFGNRITVTQDASSDGNDNYQNQTVNQGAGTRPANQTTTASEGRLAYREFNTGADSNNFTGSRGNYVEAWQQGRFDTATVNQSDNTNGSGVVYGDGTIGRARAGVYQNSSVGTVNVTQVGDNYGEVTQGNGTEQFAAAGNVATLNQTDSGDGSIPADPTGSQTVVDEFGNPGTVPNQPGQATPVRQYNQALLTQYGTANNMTVTQNARDGYVSAFQQATRSAPDGADAGTDPDIVGTTNLVMDIEQGTGNSNAYAAATPDTLAITVSATAGTSLSATTNVTQGGTNNATRVRQDSSSSFVSISQLGAGAALSGNEFNGVTQGEAGGNVIIVAQQGTNNRATAIQTATVGRSSCNGGAAGSATCPQSGNSDVQNTALNGTASPADDFFFAGGERSAEIDILQGGSGNSARAEQRGLGQYARIEQAGNNNLASILQEQAATNATAIIRQTGDNNSYYIVQNAPGQYLAVDQTGANQTVVVGRGTNGGGSYFFVSPPPGS